MLSFYQVSESYRADRRLADKVLDDGSISGYCFLLFLFCGVKVRLHHQSKEATKEFKIFSLVLFTKIHEKP